MNKKTTKTLHILGLSLGAGLALSGCGGAPVKPEAAVQKVEIMHISEAQTEAFRNFPATARASGLVDLSFRIPGELQVLNLQAGRRFKKGDVLAELDPSDYQRRVDDLTSTYDLSKKNMQRAEQLLPTQAISQSEYDVMEATYLIDKENLELAKQQLSYTKLIAPKDGRISEVIAENFESVVAGQMVVRIEDPDTIDIEVQVSEKLAGSTTDNEETRQNYKPDVTFTTMPDQTFQASYKEHETELDEATKSYIYTLSLQTREDQNILPGMSATVRVNLSRISVVERQVTLPSQSVFYRPTADLNAEASFVWIYDPSTQTAVSRDVTVGELVRDGIQVLSGLQTNDQVIVSGGVSLLEGEKVLVEGDRS